MGNSSGGGSAAPAAAVASRSAPRGGADGAEEQGRGAPGDLGGAGPSANWAPPPRSRLLGRSLRGPGGADCGGCGAVPLAARAALADRSGEPAGAERGGARALCEPAGAECGGAQVLPGNPGEAGPCVGALGARAPPPPCLMVFMRSEIRWISDCTSARLLATSLFLRLASAAASSTPARPRRICLRKCPASVNAAAPSRTPSCSGRAPRRSKGHATPPAQPPLPDHGSFVVVGQGCLVGAPGGKSKSRSSTSSKRG